MRFTPNPTVAHIVRKDLDADALEVLERTGVAVWAYLPGAPKSLPTQIIGFDLESLYLALRDSALPDVAVFLDQNGLPSGYATDDLVVMLVGAVKALAARVSELEDAATEV